MICTRKTDAERVEWSRRYKTAIRRFLRQGQAGSLLPAAGLGRQAAPLGLETLDVARVHEQALNTMAPAERSPGKAGRERIEQAAVFFKATIVPIEATHRAARKADGRIERLTRTLRLRATESSASDGQLEQAIARREAAEASADARAVRDDKLLTKARRIQERLRGRMRGLLSQQEDERKRLGGELRDEIAQGLLAIDFSLLALKMAGPVDTDTTVKGIANARRSLKELLMRGRVAGNG